ncbi:hypothetical protein AVL62_08975 [Serinicoccus chungangensis]|uniref:DUF3052 domain-containing protein n=2 Tax=Serinicoccus chungangensis TaxID=767452 RepID=A0A0W8I1S3_9MICO|nr:hypothetical protein AVL62_08975 [Serinicoccus chungangensis]
MVRKLGLREGQVVVEYGYDDDVEEAVRQAAAAVSGAPLEADDYDGVVDVVLLWWRDGEGDLADELMDALTTMEEGGCIVLLTPGAGREDRVPAADVQDACTTCSMTASGAVNLGEWLGQRLVGRK